MRELKTVKDALERKLDANHASVMEAFGFLSDAAAVSQYERQGLNSGGMKLVTLADVLELALPKVVKQATMRQPTLMNDIHAAVTAPLLDKVRNLHARRGPQLGFGTSTCHQGSFPLSSLARHEGNGRLI